MNEDPSQGSTSVKNSDKVHWTDSIWWCGFFTLILFAVSVSLSDTDELGVFGDMGGVLLLAVGAYIVSVIFFQQQPRKFRFSMHDSTRVFASVMVLLYVSSSLLDDIGFVGSLGLALLFTVSLYSLSFVIFQRKITYSFRVPLFEREKYRWALSLLTGMFVSWALDIKLSFFLDLLVGLGVFFLISTAIYALSFLFFSKKTDIPEVPTGTGFISNAS